MEHFNNSKHAFKSLVLSPDFKIRPVYRLLTGKFGTTTQLAEDNDIIIRRYTKTNDVIIEGAGILNKQEVLDKLPRNVYEWLLGDSKKLLKGEWWDGTQEDTVRYQRYRKRLMSVLRGINRPDIFTQVLAAKQILSADIPKWSTAKPLPEQLEGKDGYITYYIVMMNDTSVDVFEMDNLITTFDFSNSVVTADLNSKHLQIHNIIKIAISDDHDVTIELFTNH